MTELSYNIDIEYLFDMDDYIPIQDKKLKQQDKSSLSKIIVENTTSQQDDLNFCKKGSAYKLASDKNVNKLPLVDQKPQQSTPDITIKKQKIQSFAEKQQKSMMEIENQQRVYQSQSQIKKQQVTKDVAVKQIDFVPILLKKHSNSNLLQSPERLNRLAQGRQEVGEFQINNSAEEQLNSCSSSQINLTLAKDQSLVKLRQKLDKQQVFSQLLSKSRQHFPVIRDRGFSQSIVDIENQELMLKNSPLKSNFDSHKSIDKDKDLNQRSLSIQNQLTKRYKLGLKSLKRQINAIKDQVNTQFDDKSMIRMISFTQANDQTVTNQTFNHEDLNRLSPQKSIKNLAESINQSRISLEQEQGVLKTIIGKYCREKRPSLLETRDTKCLISKDILVSNTDSTSELNQNLIIHGGRFKERSGSFIHNNQTSFQQIIDDYQSQEIYNSQNITHSASPMKLSQSIVLSGGFNSSFDIFNQRLKPQNQNQYSTSKLTQKKSKAYNPYIQLSRQQSLSKLQLSKKSNEQLVSSSMSSCHQFYLDQEYHSQQQILPSYLHEDNATKFADKSVGTFDHRSLNLSSPDISMNQIKLPKMSNLYKYHEQRSMFPDKLSNLYEGTGSSIANSNQQTFFDDQNLSAQLQKTNKKQHQGVLEAQPNFIRVSILKANRKLSKGLQNNFNTLVET
ncbi:UNKNOWN [Stylonychia lemnae]|uniref:Uncharacterized protein n=1 Tax=Stylonychia lemnae TaxID=5949 RepID=A0A077ZWL4_STYLE|nr:UNKNOWN [Stylonychia lemnae]|eukprot:CDW72861.1 UNKNOWN [Stylonychia lemnae]